MSESLESCRNSGILKESRNLIGIFGIFAGIPESYWNPWIFSESQNLFRIPESCWNPCNLPGILSESLFLPKFQNIIGIPEIFSKSGSPESFHNLYRFPESLRNLWNLSEISESFRNFWNISGILESFHNLCNLFGIPEYFQTKTIIVMDLFGGERVLFGDLRYGKSYWLKISGV